MSRGCCGCVSALRSFATAEKLDVARFDFSHILLDTLCIGVAAGAETSFDINLAALLYEFLGKISLLSPGSDRMPLGIFVHLSVAVLVFFGSRESYRRDLAGALCGSVSIEVTHFGVHTNVTDQKYFVQTHIQKNLVRPARYEKILF